MDRGQFKILLRDTGCCYNHLDALDHPKMNPKRWYEQYIDLDTLQYLIWKLDEPTWSPVVNWCSRKYGHGVSYREFNRLAINSIRHKFLTVMPYHVMLGKLKDKYNKRNSG